MRGNGRPRPPADAAAPPPVAANSRRGHLRVTVGVRGRNLDAAAQRVPRPRGGGAGLVAASGSARAPAARGGPRPVVGGGLPPGVGGGGVRGGGLEAGW